jgi:sugar (pentulose or hexulose) kinase
MGHALGIDIGTSGVRAVAMDRTGAVIGEAAQPMTLPILEVGQIAQDPQVWWQALETALDLLLAKVAPREVEAIAVDGTSGTILPVGEAGKPLGLALMYNDPSAAELAKGLAAHAPLQTAALGATSPLARALTFKDIRGLKRILHQADWIAGRLSGRFDVSDENNALKTGYDPLARNWPDWIGKAGLDAALLPQVVPAGTKIGTVSAETAKRFRFPESAAIVAGTTDGCAAFLATGAAEGGDGVTSLGTTLTIKLLSDKPVFAPEYGIYSHRIGDRWLAGGASNTGGAALQKYFTRARMSQLEAKLDPAKPTGLDYYPSPQAGERFPVNDPAYPPKVDPRPVDDAVFFLGLLEGIAKIEALGYRRLAELGATPLARLRSVGGGAANAAWSEIRKRAMGVPFLTSASQETAAGAARLAWRGIGVAL